MYFLLLALLFTRPALADDCKDISLTLIPPAYAFNLDFDPQLALTVNRGSKGRCRYFIGFSYGNALSYASRRLMGWKSSTIPVNIYRDAAHTQILKDKPVDAIRSSDVLSGDFQGGNSSDSQTFYYWPAISPPADYLLPGLYSDSYVVSVYSGDVDGAYHFETNQVLALAYAVQSRVDLSLVDPGAPFDINDTTQVLNFGTLTTGATRTFDIVVQHNAGYSVFFSSQNGGALKHVSKSNRIPYVLEVGGAPLDLSASNASPARGASGYGRSPVGGSRHGVRATIGNIDGAVAGTYSDVITITVQSCQ